MPDRLQEIRECVEWWQPAPDKILSVSRMQELLDAMAWMLDQYDAAGMRSDRAQVIRAALERWDDNPPQVAQPVNMDAVFGMVLDANWLLGTIEGGMP